MKMNLKKGFTLIELLVVVAIIGILASVVLASLNSARSKGSDAAVKANMANMRAEAAIYYDTNNNYGTAASAGPNNATCTAANTIFALDTTFAAQLLAAKNAGGGLQSCQFVTGSGGAWAAVVQLKSNNLSAWCVDSAGASKATSALATGVQGDLDGKMASGACL